MNEMEQFRRNADRLGLCDTFAQKWSNCKSKKQLYDLACDINSLSYLAEMITKGYGLSPDYLSREYAPFLNGNCIYNGDGYTSCIYCRPPEEEVEVITTAALFIGFKGKIKISRPCEIYLCQSDATIIGDEECKVYTYLYDSSVVNSIPVTIKNFTLTV